MKPFRLTLIALLVLAQLMLSWHWTVDHAVSAEQEPVCEYCLAASSGSDAADVASMIMLKTTEQAIRNRLHQPFNPFKLSQGYSARAPPLYS